MTGETTDNGPRDKKIPDEPFDEKNLFSNIFNTENQGYWLFDGNFITIDLNDRMAFILGLNREEAIGSSFFDFLDEYNKLVFEKKLRHKISGARRIFEIELMRPDGILTPCLFNETSIFSAKEEPVGYFAFVTDLHESRLSEKALQNSLSLLQSLIDNIPNPIFYKDVNGRYMGCNRAFESFMGKRFDEISGKTVYDLSTKEMADSYSEKDRQLLADPNVAQIYESRVRCVDGTYKDVLLNKATFTLSNGNVGGLVGLIQDITERKKYESELIRAKEQAEEATKLKDKFVSLVAHDLKSPLTIITGLLRIVEADLDTQLAPKHKEIIRRVLNNSDHMVNIIEELLNISWLKTGKIQVRPRFVDGYSIAEIAIEHQGHMARQKGISIINEVPFGTRLYADFALLCEVVNNLVSNSIKFCSEGDDIFIFAPEGEKGRIAVRDTGPGIKHEIVPDIFRHDVKTTTEGSMGERGTGLGLPYCSEIMTTHGGELSVDPRPGVGAVFYINLPYHKPTILIVDDEELGLAVLRKCLESIDVEIVEATDGVEALKAISRSRPDLVVTDIQMPNMNGFNMVKRIRSKPEIKTVPVIMITGDTNIKTREEALRVGADDFIQKPIAYEDLIPRVRRFVI